MSHGLKPLHPGETIRLSSCTVAEDGDFRKVMELARSAILGRGARAARIGVCGNVRPDMAAELSHGGRRLSFEELELAKTGDRK